jgi:pyruvate/2-oxoglutarate/acetoin dehydrogenase E1 component
MPKLSYQKALNRALREQMESDPSVFVLGEDIAIGINNVTSGLLERFGPQRVLESPISEQGFTGFASGAAMAGMRPVVEFQIGSLLLLVIEQIANQAGKFTYTSGGQFSFPVTYLLPHSGNRVNWGAHHSDELYSVFAHLGIKTAVPATPSDAYGLFLTAIRDDDPVAVFIPVRASTMRENVDYADLCPLALGTGRVRREGSDVTVVAVGHLVHDALAMADQLADEMSVEVFDPRTLFPFDWAGLAASLERTGRLVVIEDSNRFGGVGAEILATAAEEMRLVAPPRRVTRADGAILGVSAELDMPLEPNREQLVAALEAVMKGRD